ALLHRGGADRHVHHVGAEPLARELEGALGSGRGFEEEVDEGAAAQVVALLGDLAAELDGLFREVQESDDLGARKAFDSKKMAVRKGGVGSVGRDCHQSALYRLHKRRRQASRVRMWEAVDSQATVRGCPAAE